MLATTTDKLLGRTLQRAVLTERFENEQIRQVTRFLDRKVYPQVERQLASRVGRIAERGMDTGPSTTRRLTNLKRSITKITTAGFREARAQLGKNLTEFGVDEVNWQNAALRSSMPVVFETTLPTMGALRAIVLSRPFEGMILREHFATLSKRLVTTIDQAIKVGLAAGETTDQIIRRVRGTVREAGIRGGSAFAKSRRGVATTVRTAITHTSNLGRESMYLQNPKLIKGVQWISTFDGGTCPRCGGLDTKVFNVGQGPRPPAHHQCRCTTIPVVRSQRPWILARRTSQAAR